jgi:5'-nucleotidase
LENNAKPTILVTNDDGIHANGLWALVDAVKPLGNVVVISSSKSNSGKSHSVTLEEPLYYHKVKEESGLVVYVCSGTPVDCVKLGLNMILDKLPDFIVSGINHGSNSSVSILYSGTMGAAIEGSLNGVPSVGFSLTAFDADLDFEPAKKMAGRIMQNVVNHGISPGVCLNVNIPYVKLSEIKGVKVCRQTRGLWVEKFDRRFHPHGKEYLWLTGNFENSEPESTDTDEFALANNYVSIVPVQIDLTAYSEIQTLKEWNYELKD